MSGSDFSEKIEKIHIGLMYFDCLLVCQRLVSRPGIINQAFVRLLVDNGVNDNVFSTVT